MIAAGELGDIRIVNMQFAHGFHHEAVEMKNPSTRWRVDPRFAGPSYVLGDLATHPLFIAETMVRACRSNACCAHARALSKAGRRWKITLTC